MEVHVRIEEYNGEYHYILRILNLSPWFLILHTEDLHLSCRGTYNPSSDVIHIDCDANNPLKITECELDDGETILCKA